MINGQELTLVGAILPHDDPHGGDDLLGHWRRHGTRVDGTV